MAKETQETLVDVEEVYSKTERYIEENKKSLAIIIGAILAIIAGYFAWSKLYVGPKELEAQKEMFMAEKYFETDSLNKAINGDGNYNGFKYIVDEYGMTKSGNLAQYYLGVSYLRKGEFQKAVDHLQEYDGEDQVLAPVAVGALGDAYLELGKTSEAVENYLNAAKMSQNGFTTPIYLFKAGLAYEQLKDFKNAVKVYEQIKTDHPQSTEGRDIEKYIARAKVQAEA